MAETSVYMYVSISFQYLIVRMLFWTLVLCQLETNESLEGKFPGGLINRGKTPSKKIRLLYKLGRHRLLEPH